MIWYLEKEYKNFSLWESRDSAVIAGFESN